MCKESIQLKIIQKSEMACKKSARPLSLSFFFSLKNCRREKFVFLFFLLGLENITVIIKFFDTFQLFNFSITPTLGRRSIWS